MTQLGGSLRFVQLSAVTQLLAELGSTGRLRLTNADWSGEIVIRAGEIVDARLGGERGRAALEAIALALTEGAFSFVDESVLEHSAEPIVSADERRVYLDRLGAERERIARVIPSPRLVARLVEAPDGAVADTQITIGAAALQLIPTLVVGHSLMRVATQRGVARTLREAAVLIEGGLVTLDPDPTPAPTQAIKPASVRVQPVSSTGIGSHRPTPHPAPHPNWRQTLASFFLHTETTATS